MRLWWRGCGKVGQVLLPQLLLLVLVTTDQLSSPIFRFRLCQALDRHQTFKGLSLMSAADGQWPQARRVWGSGLGVPRGGLDG